MEQQVGYRQRWWTLAVLCLSLVVVGLDNLVVNVALPTLQRELGASVSELQWIVDAYTLVFAALLLVTGSIGDRFGRKLTLNVGLLTFLVASIGAAYSGSAEGLIAFRAGMGVGAALIMPSTLSILTAVFPASERGRAISIWAGAAVLGIPLGPVVGGLLLERFWWGSVFLINLPIVLIALGCGWFLVPESRDPQSGRPDVVGAILSISGLATLVYGIIEAPIHGWTDATTLLTIGAGLLLLALFVGWELRAATPMLPMGFFRIRGFSSSVVAIAFMSFGLFGALYLLTQYLQFVLGHDPLDAGIRLLPILTIAVGAQVGNRLAERAGSKVPISAGLATITLGLFLLSSAGVSSEGYVLGTLALLGLGMGTTMAPAADLLMGSVPRERAGVGSSMSEAALQLGGTFGIAVLGSVQSSAYEDSMTSVTSTILAEQPRGAANVPPEAMDATTSSIGAAMQVAEQLGGPIAEHVLSASGAAFADGMNTATLVAAVVALTGLALVLVFLPAKPQLTTEARSARQRVKGAQPGDVARQQGAQPRSQHAS